jgi:hypothetical protein
MATTAPAKANGARRIPATVTTKPNAAKPSRAYLPYSIGKEAAAAPKKNSSRGCASESLCSNPSPSHIKPIKTVPAVDSGRILLAWLCHTGDTAVKTADHVPTRGGNPRRSQTPAVSKMPKTPEIRVKNSLVPSMPNRAYGPLTSKGNMTPCGAGITSSRISHP